VSAVTVSSRHIHSHNHLWWLAIALASVSSLALVVAALGAVRCVGVSGLGTPLQSLVVSSQKVRRGADLSQQGGILLERAEKNRERATRAIGPLVIGERSLAVAILMLVFAGVVVLAEMVKVAVDVDGDSATCTVCAAGVAPPTICVKLSDVGVAEMVPPVTLKVTGMRKGLPAAVGMVTQIAPLYVPVVRLEASALTLKLPGVGPARELMVSQLSIPVLATASKASDADPSVVTCTVCEAGALPLLDCENSMLPSDRGVVMLPLAEFTTKVTGRFTGLSATVPPVEVTAEMATFP